MKAEIVCIIDRSGSMAAIAGDAVGGFNSFLKMQREIPGEANLTLVLFNHGYLVVHEGLPLKDVPDLTFKTYVPEGTTALLDAVGRTIDDVGKRLAATPNDRRPDKIIVAILTDGAENSSLRYTQEQVAAKIKHQTETYQWEFHFLASNMDAVAQAAQYNIPTNNAVNVSTADALGTRQAFASYSANVTRSRSKT